MIPNSDLFYTQHFYLLSLLVLTATQSPKHILLGHHAFHKLIWMSLVSFRFTFYLLVTLFNGLQPQNSPENLVISSPLQRENLGLRMIDLLHKNIHDQY